MKKIVLTLIGLIFIVVELSITNKFTFFGVHLNLLLIYATLLATNVDSFNNYLTIILIGAIYDLLIGLTFGINLAWMLVVTWLIRTVIDKLYEEKKWSIALIFILTSFLSCIYYFFVNQFLFVPQKMEVLTGKIFYSVGINSCLGIFLWMITRPFFKHIMKNWW